MKELESLNLSLLKRVKVKMVHGLESEFLCIDLGEGVWKDEGDNYQAHTIRMIRSPNTPYTPKWQSVVSKKYYVTHEINDFFPSNDS